MDQPRLDCFEISPAGPLFGPKMMSSAGEVAKEEAELLSQERMTLADFSGGGGETRGGRRAYRLAVPDCEIAQDGPDAWL